MTRAELHQDRPEKLEKIERILQKHQASRTEIVSVSNTVEEKEKMREMWNESLREMRNICQCYCDDLCLQTE